jgi:hypothetical protein
MASTLSSRAVCGYDSSKLIPSDRDVQKTLNKANLERLGTSKLAELVMERAITDYGAVLKHEGFVAALRQKHGRK